MTEAWLSEPEQQAWRRFAAVLEILPGVLDSQLTHQDALTHFDYLTLAMLSEAPERTLRMTRLAELTHATLARLSNVVRRLEARGLVERLPCPEDRRATNARLSEQGWAKVRQAAPGHVATVRRYVIDPLGAAGVADLAALCDRLLESLDPDRRMVGRAAQEGRPTGGPAACGNNRQRRCHTEAVGRR